MNIEKIAQTQRQFFSTGKTMDLYFRLEQLTRFKKALQQQETQILEALKKDLNKPVFEAYTAEIMQVLNELKFTIKHLKKWVKPQKVKTPLELQLGRSEIYHHPYGVVLNIAPWNYPIQTALVPLVSILAAGNCAVLKPSEFAPNCSRIIAELINENFPPEYCHVAEGGVEETQQLLSQKWDFIAFTGSPRVGQIIAEAAARNLTPTLLELGGKSPCIVHKDVKLPIAVSRILWGKFLNAGQTCVAPDYLLAEKSIADQLVHQLSKKIDDFYGQSPEKSADYCRIINEKHFQRLSAYISSKNLVHGGSTHGDELYIEPTILYPCHWSDEIMKEEIFGPILPVIPYDDIDEAIQKIKERERPLAFYIFTCDKKLQKKLIESISFGGGAVNATVLQTANLHLPFGGVGNSGMGRYHGRKGFDTFTYEKSIFKKSTRIDPNLIYPPYKNKLKIIKRFFG